MLNLLRQILFFMILSFIAQGIFAQNWQSATIVMSMHSSSGNGSSNNQSILQTLAIASGKSSETIELVNEVQYSVELATVNELQSEIRLRIGNQSFSGDTDYRKFNLTEKLVADHFKGRVIVHSLFGTIEERPFNITIDSNQIDYNLGVISLKSFPVRNLEIAFDFYEFSQEARDDFNTTISFINAYWAACNYLNQLSDESRKSEEIINSSPENNFVFWDKIRKGIKLGEKVSYTIEQVQLRDDGETLRIRLEDAVRLATRYETLLAASLGRRHNDPNLTASIARHYIESLKLEQAKLQEHDFRDSDFLSQAARLQFDEVFVSILNVISPKSDPELGAALTLGGLVHLADEHFQKSDLANALIFYEDAKVMNQHYDFVEDSSQITERIDAAKLGLLQSHLRIAAKAVEIGNEKLANEYKQKSNVFVEEKLDEQLISQLPEQSDELVETYIRKGNEYLDQQLYQQSIEAFDKAASTAKNFYNIRHKEQINLGLFAAHRAVFSGLIQDAEQLWSNSRMEEAKKRLQQAIDYRQDHIDYLRNSSEAYHLKSKMDQNLALNAPSGNLTKNKLQVYSDTPRTIFEPSMIADAKTSILEHLKNAQLKAWGNSIDEAWELYGVAIENSKQFGLDSDPEVVAAMADLDNRMIDRICLNNKFRLDELMERVQAKIRSNQPDQLKPMLEEIIEIGTNNQGCMLKFEKAQQLYANYLPYFQYLDDYNMIIETMYTKGIHEALPLYVAFDQNIANYQLERFGVKHITLVQYIKQRQNAALSWSALNYFVDLVQTDEIVELLLLLRDQEFMVEQSTEIQAKTGTFLAVAHWNAGAYNSQEQIDRIIGKDKRFGVLRKHYLQAAKSLKKQNR